MDTYKSVVFLLRAGRKDDDQKKPLLGRVANMDAIISEEGEGRAILIIFCCVCGGGGGCGENKIFVVCGFWELC